MARRRLSNVESPDHLSDNISPLSIDRFNIALTNREHVSRPIHCAWPDNSDNVRFIIPSASFVALVTSDPRVFPIFFRHRSRNRGILSSGSFAVRFRNTRHCIRNQVSAKLSIIYPTVVSRFFVTRALTAAAKSISFADRIGSTDSYTSLYLRDIPLIC